MHNAMGAFQKFQKFSNFFHFCGGNFVGGAKRVIGHQKISFAKWKGLGLGLEILNSKLDEHEKVVWENLNMKMLMREVCSGKLKSLGN